MVGLQSEQVLNLTGTYTVFEAMEASRALIQGIHAAAAAQKDTGSSLTNTSQPGSGVHPGSMALQRVMNKTGLPLNCWIAPSGQEAAEGAEPSQVQGIHCPHHFLVHVTCCTPANLLQVIVGKSICGPQGRRESQLSLVQWLLCQAGVDRSVPWTMARQETWHAFSVTSPGHQLSILQHPWQCFTWQWPRGEPLKSPLWFLWSPLPHTT